METRSGTTQFPATADLEATVNSRRDIQAHGESAERPLRTSSLVDLAYERLQRRIISGRLKEGDRLVIDELAREFGSSPIPVREALVRLYAERFLTYEKNKGYRVAPKPDPIELEQLFQGRLILEIGAVKEGLANVDENTLFLLESINRELATIRLGTSIDENREFIVQNERFHLELVGLCRNPFIIDAYRRLGYHQRIMQTLYRQGDPDSERVIREHEEIIAAIASGDPGAVEDALRRHIVFGQSRLNDLGIVKA